MLLHDVFEPQKEAVGLIIGGSYWNNHPGFQIATADWTTYDFLHEKSDVENPHHHNLA
jgi:hypothetical protein